MSIEILHLLFSFFPDDLVTTGAGALFDCPISSSHTTGFLLNIGQSTMHNCSSIGNVVQLDYNQLLEQGLKPLPRFIVTFQLTNRDKPSPTNHP